MALAARGGLRWGAVFGVALDFTVLIGLNVVLAGMIADMLGLAGEGGDTVGMVVYLALFGAWAGYKGAARRDPDSWSGALTGGILAGGTCGLLYGPLVQALAVVQDAGIDLRRYLFQLSPASIEAVQLGQDPPAGALSSMVVIAVGGLVGALVARGVVRSRSGAAVRRLAAALASGVAARPVVRRVREHPNTWGVGAALGIGALVVLPLYLSEYWNSTFGTVGIYMLMGLGLNIVVGLAGLLDLGYVAFFAVGAYTVGLLTAPKPLGLELGFWPVLPIAVIAAATAGVLLGLPVLRLRGDYLAIVTLGFGEIIRVLVMSQWLAPVLGGPQGIRDIAGPALFGRDLTSQRAFIYLIIVSILLVIALTVRLQDSRLGRSWVAMREDETVARATGVNVYYAKLLAFAIGAAFAGLGGAIFASRNQYTGPEDHILMVSINVLCLVIVGGMGSIPGIVAGAFVLKGLPEVLRPLQDYRLLAFGALLVVMMIARPQGIWPSQRRRLELQDRSARAGRFPPPSAPPGHAAGDSSAVP